MLVQLRSSILKSIHINIFQNASDVLSSSPSIGKNLVLGFCLQRPYWSRHHFQRNRRIYIYKSLHTLHYFSVLRSINACAFVPLIWCYIINFASKYWPTFLDLVNNLNISLIHSLKIPFKFWAKPKKLFNVSILYIKINN